MKRPAEILKITRKQSKIMDAAVNIHREPGDAEHAAFLASQLVQVTLPHSDPGDVPIWSRTSGNVTLSIVRMHQDVNGKMIGYPYGTIPRLLLYWLTSEAVRTKSPIITLGASLSEFMREIGLNPRNGTGDRSDTSRLREQMVRLFAAGISFRRIENTHARLGGLAIAKDLSLWWTPTAQAPLIESYVQLDEDFFKAITTAPVPLDMRALKALKNSALALDLYAWATHKSYVVSKKGAEQFVSFSVLQSQLGTEYGDLRNFRRKLLQALVEVKAVYPSLRCEQVRGGLSILSDTTPAILPR